MTDPNVWIADAWLNGTVQANVAVRAITGSWHWPWGYAYMRSYFRVDGGDWVSVPSLDLSLGILGPILGGGWNYIFSFNIPEGASTVETRGAVEWYTNIGHKFKELKLSTTWVLNLPSTDPWVATRSVAFLDDTTIRICAEGDPGGYSSADLYMEYREIGEASSYTSKETITDQDFHGWDETVTPDKDYEARAVLDYNSTTIYGAWRQVTGLPGSYGECSYPPFSGSGTGGDPYVITDICHLNWVRTSITAYYVLGNDIDASVTEYWNDGAGFEPIAQAIPWFAGSFDGHGYKISNLFINRPTEDDVGLFGRCSGATLIDVILENFDIRGHTFVGALAGEFNANNTASDVHATGGYVEGQHYLGGLIGNISTASMTDCDYQGTVAQKARDWGGNKIGGFGGNISSSTILCCFADITITSESIQENIGGFAGDTYINNNIDQCYSKGNVYVSWFFNKFYSYDFRAGGFTGRIAAGADVNDCYSRVNIIVDTTDYGTRLGGFAGDVNPGATGMLDNVYSTGSISGGTGVEKGGLVGRLGAGPVTDSFWDKETSGLATSAAGTGKTTAQMKTISTFTDAGWNFDTVWGIETQTNDGYPYIYCCDEEEEYEIKLTGLFVRGDEIQVIANSLGFRSPDFGANWYPLNSLPTSGAITVGFDADNPQNSFVGCDNELYIFDSVDGQEYTYEKSQLGVISGMTTSIDVDFDGVGALGTDDALHKTLDFGHTTHLWLIQPVTDVSIGGSYVINPSRYFNPIAANDAGLYETDATYSTAWNSATADIVCSGYDAIIGQSITESDYTIQRLGLVFDTTTLSGIILSASIRLYVTQVDDAASFDVVVQGDNTYPSAPIVAGDYNRTHYSGDGGSVASSNILASTHLTIPLNSTGKGWINAGGNSRFIIRTDEDINGSVPSVNEYIKVNQSEKGGSYAPMLIITLQTEL